MGHSAAGPLSAAAGRPDAGARAVTFAAKSRRAITAGRRPALALGPRFSLAGAWNGRGYYRHRPARPGGGTYPVTAGRLF
jgi:hypothetical protein